MTPEIIAEEQPMARGEICDRLERMWLELGSEIKRQELETERGPDVRLHALRLATMKELARLWGLGKVPEPEPEPEPEPSEEELAAEAEALRVDAAAEAAAVLARVASKLRPAGRV